MPMNSEVLKTAIKSRITSEMGIDLSKAVDPSALDIVIEEIIKHIISFAVVSTNTTSIVAVTSVAGVTPGAGVSGPGAGSATGSGVGTIS